MIQFRLRHRPQRQNATHVGREPINFLLDAGGDELLDLLGLDLSHGLQANVGDDELATRPVVDHDWLAQHQHLPREQRPCALGQRTDPANRMTNRDHPAGRVESSPEPDN